MTNITEAEAKRGMLLYNTTRGVVQTVTLLGMVTTYSLGLFGFVNAINTNKSIGQEWQRIEALPQKQKKVVVNDLIAKRDKNNEALIISFFLVGIGLFFAYLRDNKISHAYGWLALHFYIGEKLRNEMSN